MRYVLRILLASAVSAFAVACSDASGTTRGGDARYDASTPDIPDAGEGGPSVPSCAKDGGATWSDLYRDCFGPGEATCGSAMCHESSKSAGGGVWVCGDTKDTCFTGIQSIIDNPNPTLTSLYGTLRKDPSCGVTCMPRSSNFTFEPEDLARIKTWISAGAPNN